MEDPIEKKYPREQERDGFALPRLSDFLGPNVTNRF
jgi:hypothetical protein